MGTGHHFECPHSINVNPPPQLAHRDVPTFTRALNLPLLLSEATPPISESDQAKFPRLHSETPSDGFVKRKASDTLWPRCASTLRLTFSRRACLGFFSQPPQSLFQRCASENPQKAFKRKWESLGWTLCEISRPRH